MLKFFRKIRQKLLAEGNLKNYLAYAIGEILLVVIGILIALQINNVKEIKQNYRAETNALIELKREYQSNARLLEEHLIRKEGRFKEWTEFLSIISNEELPASKRARDRPSSGARMFTPSQNALNELLYTGNIEKIQNDSLRNLLASWNTDLGLFQIREKEHQDFWHNQYRPYERTMISQFAGPKIPTFSYISRDTLWNPFLTEMERQTLRLKAYDDLVYQNLFMRNHYLLFSTIRDGKALQNTFDQIINLLEEEISNRR
jgi:hypothetical protein